MKVEFGEAKEFRQVYVAPASGQFALEAEPQATPHWDHCREQFANRFTEETTGFYLSHDAGQDEGVAGFLGKTEEILGLPGRRAGWSRSTYHKTNKSTVMWLGPSRFWTACAMRRSLLTILIRCGLSYAPDRDNYEEALYGHGPESANEHVRKAQEYARSTRPAVMRFLFGFTEYVKSPGDVPSSWNVNRYGWQEVFKNKDQDAIRYALVLPEGEEKLYTVIGVDALWA